MLQAALDYKAKCEFNAENWVAKRQKYENIFDILLKEYPDEKEKYPIKGKMTKAAKLKSIQSAFKKVIDCGKKKGWRLCGFTFFDYCNDLWGVCPAVTSIENSIDSSKSLSNDYSDSFSPVGSSSVLDIEDAKDFSNKKETSEFSNEQEISKCLEENDVDADNSECDLPQPSARHKKFKEMLNKRKQKKLTTKFSQESQALYLLREDLQLKK